MAKLSFVNGDPLTPSWLHAQGGTDATTGHQHTGLNQDGSIPKVQLTTANHVTGVLPRANYIPSRYSLEGMRIRNSVTHDYETEVGPGECADVTGVTRITLSSAMIKDIQDVWAAGTTNGGRASAVSLTDATWYRVYVISDGTNVDAGYDTSVTAANLLSDSGYSYYRYLGSVYYVNGTTYIRYAYNTDDLFVWETVQQDANATALPLNTTVDITLSVPSSPLVEARVSVVVSNGSNNWATQIWDDMGTTFVAGNGLFCQGSAGDIAAMQITAMCNWVGGLNQLHVRQYTGANAGTITVRTHGWRDLSRKAL